MARATFVKAARKDYPDHGIKKGESYYWWAFRFGGKHRSKEPPKPSQLTHSEYLSQLYALQEQVGELNLAPTTVGDLESLKSDVEVIMGDMESLRDETDEKRGNVEDAFPGGSPVLETLEVRVEACENNISLLDDASSELESLIREVEARQERLAKRRKKQDEKKDPKVEAPKDEDEEEEEEDDGDEDLGEDELTQDEQSRAEDIVGSIEIEEGE